VRSCFLFLLSLDSRYGFVAGAISLMALVGTSVMDSLVAVQEEEGPSVLAVRLGRVTVIAAVAIYCASLLAYSSYWLVPGDYLPGFLAPYVVAAFSWPVLPATVAKLRFG
jgi:hypothetical protein